ncbi:hypothetical protein IF2G_00508 [Cordyceps javanica]|nr:hypothetical protein IF2G_00508 [Cordyceps javanica]
MYRRDQCECKESMPSDTIYMHASFFIVSMACYMHCHRRANGDGEAARLGKHKKKKKGLHARAKSNGRIATSENTK